MGGDMPLPCLSGCQQLSERMIQTREQFFSESVL